MSHLVDMPFRTNAFFKRSRMKGGVNVTHILVPQSHLRGTLPRGSGGPIVLRKPVLRVGK